MNDNKRVALVLGANSQDGKYLIEHLLEKGYKVIGAVRRSSTNNLMRIENLLSNITLEYWDITDAASISRLILNHSFTHIFNLTAQSYVGVSFDLPVYTGQVDALGVTNLLETVRQINPKIKIYQASTSELFGGVVENMPEKGFNENSIMSPKSPYAVAKLYAYEMCRLYRESYGMFISNGILFNHSSPHRGEEFVEKKIVDAFKRKDTILRLGRPDTKRDFGHSYDYVRAMVKILEHDIADDWVVATGSMLSPGEIVSICQNVFDYSPEIVWNYSAYLRPNEVKVLLGDSSKIRRELNWKPEFNTATKVIMDIIKGDS